METPEEKKAYQRLQCERRKAARRERKMKEKEMSYGPLVIKTSTPMYDLDFHYADLPTRVKELSEANERICDIMRRSLVNAFDRKSIVVVDAVSNWRDHTTKWTAEITAKGVLMEKEKLTALFQEIAEDVVSNAKVQSRWKRPSEAEDEIMYDPKREI